MCQNMPFIEHYDDVFDSYITLIAIQVGDHGEWIKWFLWENDCGQKAFEAGYDQQTKPIKNLFDLLELIEISNQKNNVEKPTL